MKVLYISSFAAPNPQNSNSTSVTLTSKLLEEGLDVSLLTCSADPTWVEGSAIGSEKLIENILVVDVEKTIVPTLLLNLPKAWYQYALKDDEWEDAVSWGVTFLKSLRPEVVHLQQWQNLWWLLQSAHQLGIPTIYSVNDYGMTCQRTLLITGEGTPCDGVARVDKCSECVLTGRGVVGKLNEFIVRSSLGRFFVNSFFDDGGKGFLASRGAVRLPVGYRVSSRLNRSRKILSNLSACIVGSPFGVNVMMSNGVPADVIRVQPWFHDVRKSIPINIKNEVKVGFIGRVSPEKGLHLLLDSLQDISEDVSLTLRIAGGVEGAYAESLHNKFSNRAGHVKVEWLGWLNKLEKEVFYNEIDMIVAPSLCLETGPLSIMESLAHKRPVLCTDLPPMKWVIDSFKGGWVFPYGDKEALAIELCKIVNDRSALRSVSNSIHSPPGLRDYINCVKGVYEAVIE